MRHTLSKAHIVHDDDNAKVCPCELLLPLPQPKIKEGAQDGA